MSKKYKKHTYADRLKYMHMIEDGFSIKSISEQYGIDHILLSSLWATYQSKGRVALEKKCHTEATLEIKIEAIRDFEEKHLSLVNIMTKYGISRAAFYQWRKKLHSGGMDALSADGRGRPPGMGRPKKKTVEQMTELERLQKENQELKTELALLKKVRALVEERNARLYEIGHKPSKD